MKMLFLGCGAADYDWSRYGEDGVLGSTLTLLDDSILLDCGPTATAAMQKFNVEYDQIIAIVNTHSHSDHLNLDEVRKISGKRKIPFYGSAEACAQVADCCEVHPLTFSDEFVIDNKNFLTLPSNHAVDNLKEEFYLEENHWRAIDEIERFIASRAPFGISNKLINRIERFTAVYLAMGGEDDCLDRCIASVVLPTLVKADKSALKSEDRGLKDVIDEALDLFESGKTQEMLSEFSIS